MAKSLFEEMGGRYERQGDYLIPCLTLPAEKEQPIGLFGRRHLDYLKQHRRVTYINLLTSGRLNVYLADIDRQAQERFEWLIEGMKQAQGITERLKAENALEWARKIQKFRFFLKSKLMRNPNFSENGLIIGDSCRKKFGFHFTKCNAPIMTK